MPWPLYIWERDLLPTVLEVGWVSGLIWMGVVKQTSSHIFSNTPLLEVVRNFICCQNRLVL
jgi:hypothetical protein